MKRSGWTHTAIVAGVALVVRAAVVVWAHARFPPVADGTFYDMFARRLAHGLGYTVAWPDGAVTYAAHYPVGYPALLALAYLVFGASPGVAMGVNTAIGTLASACAHRLALRELSPRIALPAALAVALHPALVFYTPAVMTEAVAAGLLVIAAALLPHAGGSKKVYIARICAAGVVFGVATLVRPQTIVFAPVLALIFVRHRTISARAAAAAGVLAVTLLTLAPWTARNCARMHRCAPVSVNGGWNLLIGVHTPNGAWTPLEAPDACKTVWDEAQKDLCFERAARAEIAASPAAWLEKAPRKLGVTFDAFLAGPWYLHQSNPSAFGARAELVSGAIETLVSRLLLAAALVASAPLFRLRVRRKRWPTALRFVLALAGIAFALSRTGWPAYAFLGAACFVRGRGERRSPLRVSTALVVGATMLTHAAFFGAGRYGLLVVPFVTLAAFACVRPKALSPSVPSASGR